MRASVVVSAWNGAVLVLGGLLLACATAVDDGTCERDLDCGEFRFCDPAGSCRCRSDDACDASEFCNLAGSCQSQRECFVDEDCHAEGNLAAICDTRLPLDDALGVEDNVRSSTAGQCVTLNASDKQCLLDSHCGFGAYCGSGLCVPGCRDNADCGLGEPCINAQCDATPGACNEVGYCEFGQTCSAPASESALRCEDHREVDVLCQRCNPTQCFDDAECAAVGGTCESLDPSDFLAPSICTVCGSVDVPCLIDQAIIPLACAEDSQCTQGVCTKAQCISDEACGTDASCVGGSPGGFFDPPTIGRCSSGVCGDFFCGTSACNDETDPCPRGYRCATLVGISNNTCSRSGGQCTEGRSCSADAPGELNENGFCSCLNDADCPDGLPCQEGGCVLGTTCAPSDGLLCADVLP